MKKKKIEVTDEEMRQMTREEWLRIYAPRAIEGGALEKP